MYMGIGNEFHYHFAPGQVNTISKYISVFIHCILAFKFTYVGLPNNILYKYTKYR